MIHGPAEGEQACGETGAGRMLEALELTDIVVSQFSNNKKPLSGKHILITAGPTREAIDPVRFISNRSSGKMGYAIAKAAKKLGATVTLISGPVALEAPEGVNRQLVESAKEMHEKTLGLAKTADIFIATAAVSDYSPTNIADQKIKKTQDNLSLDLNYNPDILFDVSHKFPDLFSVGFAAETEDLIKHAKGKLERKKLDMIVANPVGKNQGFDQDTNQVEIIWKDGQVSLPEKDKTALAEDIMNIIAEKFTHN
jgi:phosphopantothenoylcysteine decarboxylase/phosphopantothenate--cysteine ligase